MQQTAFIYKCVWLAVKHQPAFYVTTLLPAGELNDKPGFGKTRQWRVELKRQQRNANMSITWQHPANNLTRTEKRFPASLADTSADW